MKKNHNFSRQIKVVKSYLAYNRNNFTNFFAIKKINNFIHQIKVVNSYLAYNRNIFTKVMDSRTAFYSQVNAQAELQQLFDFTCTRTTLRTEQRGRRQHS